MRRFRQSFLILFLLLSFVVPVFAEPIPVKVMVLSMFEVGKNSGDFAGEFQHWYTEYFDKAASFDVKGAYAPLFVNKDGVAGTVTGMGKARSAATLMAILKDPRFDFSKTYFITSGCAGVSPETGTLGDVFICDWVVDYDLGNDWKESDGEPGQPTFIRKDSYNDNAAIQLNQELANWALRITKNVKLDDAEKAAEYRKLYPQKIANSYPSIRTGSSVTGDNYWHGKGASKQAAALSAYYKASPYGVTQMEDNAFAIVLRSMGLLDRYLVIRDVVNFDQPHPKQKVKESLEASSGGFSVGMVNGHRVGSSMVHHILENWDVWKKGVPALPKK